MAGEATALHAAVGLSAVTGTYVRLAAIAGGGPAWRDGETRTGARLDLLARFHLDPFREARWGLYGAGGIGVIADGFGRTSPVIVVGAGLELPARGRQVWAVEVGLGAGVRAGIALRRTDSVRR